MSNFPSFTAQVPQLIAALTDQANRSILTFTWNAAINEGGLTLDHYAAQLWSDADRTSVLPGGAAQNVTAALATFSGVPKGAAYLLDVTAVSTTGQSSAPVSLMMVSPYAPGESVGATPQTADIAYPASEDILGVAMPLRPAYGSYDGVKRWSRVVTFGPGADQVGPLDVQYFLMAASDEIDAMLAGKFTVPLSPVIYPSGASRYPPPIPMQCERLAAAMLVSSRRSLLTESQSTYASYLEASASDRIQQLADLGYIEGQCMAHGFALQVCNAAPRQFSMRGDPAGHVWNAATGYSDMATFQPHNLPYSMLTWRYR